MATNNGTATAYPIFKATGPGTIYQLANYTTGSMIYFELTLLSGETVTLDFRPGKKTFNSTFRGNIINTILPGSDVQNFRLLPGSNDISIFISTTAATATLTWDNRHWSVDGGTR